MRWIWLAVLVACGDNVAPRLAPVTYDLDGAMFATPGLFHDRVRDEDCASVRWGDGATYWLQVIAWNTLDGVHVPLSMYDRDARLPDGLVYDAVLDADCGLAPYAGAVRCVPEAVAVSTYFADATCMTERDVAVIKTAACSAPERFAFRDAYHAIGPVVTDALYVSSTGDRCMVQPPDDEPHAIGPALAPETFVPAL